MLEFKCTQNKCGTKPPRGPRAPFTLDNGFDGTFFRDLCFFAAIAVCRCIVCWLAFFYSVNWVRGRREMERERDLELFILRDATTASSQMINSFHKNMMFIYSRKYGKQRSRNSRHQRPLTNFSVSQH